MFSARLLLYVVLPPLLAFWALRSKGAKSKYGFLYVVHTTLCEKPLQLRTDPLLGQQVHRLQPAQCVLGVVFHGEE